MKNRLLFLLIIVMMLITGIIWAFVCIAYWIFTGKTLPIFEKIMDYIFNLVD